MLDALRKKQSERRALTDLDPGATPDIAVSVANRLMLIQALSKLTDTYRHVFVLQHVEHCSVAETARVMGWSESNVKTTDQRAIARMREILGAFEEGELS